MTEAKEIVFRQDTAEYPYIYTWGNNSVRAKYKEKRCQIIAVGKKNTIAVQFEDDFQMTTSRRAIRKANQ